MVMQACSSNLVSNVSTNWWWKLWKLNIPQKIKIFIWKGCYDWIPTRFNLRGRRIQVIDLCPWCTKSSETTIHALLECNKFKSARIHWIPNKVLIRDVGEVFEWAKCFLLKHKVCQAGVLLTGSRTCRRNVV
ncbi:hypothetical protein QYF36_007797 [Acer negundo]|nr:hypothetical protein QYF36_007797 [Acer negundo]